MFDIWASALDVALKTMSASAATGSLSKTLAATSSQASAGSSRAARTCARSNSMRRAGSGSPRGAISFTPANLLPPRVSAPVRVLTGIEIGISSTRTPKCS